MIARIQDVLAKRRAAAGEGDAGFTLIELLVVVIIIGILAAIAIPIYLNVQNSAKDASVQSDLTNDKTAAVAYYTANGSMPAMPTTAVAASTALQASGWTGTSVYDVSSAAAAIGAFCLKAVSQSGVSFWITQAGSAAVTTKPTTGCSS